MAHYELIHQLKELGFPNIGIAQGTAQALYIGNFLYTNSSTPGNLTVFAFHKQEPLLDTCQNDHLVCHLVQTQGQKKSLEEAKTSQKQTVHIPKDFNGMGTQLQLFTAAWEIFFGEESICQQTRGGSSSLLDATRRIFATKLH